MKKIEIKQLNQIISTSIAEDDQLQDTINYLFAEYPEGIVTIIDVELENCINNRKAEYPTIEDFLNAYFDGGEVAVQELQTRRLAVKSKYPKPIV